MAGNQILDGVNDGAFSSNYLSSPSALNPDVADINIEQNYSTWYLRRLNGADPPASPPREEFAISGILWDLVDAAADAEPAPDVRWPDPPAFTPADSITVEPKVITEAFAAHTPNTLVALRSALLNRLPASSTSPASNPRGSGLSQLDEIFVMHRAFHDANGDWKYQAGETIGKAANADTWLGANNDGTQPASAPARPWRENVKKIEGSNIQMDLKDKSGNRIESGEVKVSLEFGPGFEHLNSTRTVPVHNGTVYFEMPPNHYPVRAVLTVPGATNDPLVIENASYWTAVATATDSFVQKTFVFPTPTLQSIQPASEAVGTNLVIHGSDFSTTAADNRVMFGDLRAQVAAATSTRLTVTVPGPLATGAVAVTATVAGRTSNPQTFTVTVPGIQIPTPELSFGIIPVGTTADRTFTIRNTGGASLTISSIVATSAFRVVSPATPFSVAPGGQQDVTIRFQPSSAGDQTTDLAIKSNDAMHPELLVFATAVAMPPSDPEIEVAPRALNFGSILVGASQTARFTIRNTGTAPLTISSVSTTNPQFTLVTPATPFTIATGAKQGVDLRFTPTAAGVHSSSFTLGSNDRDEAVVVLQLRGDGSTAAGDETIQIDDGTVEMGIAGNGVTVVHRLTPTRYPATLKTIRLFLYQYPNLPSPAGAQITLIAFAGASGTDRPPAGPPLLVARTVTIPAVTTTGGVFDFPITEAATITGGDFYVGYRSPNPAGGVVYAADSNGLQRQRGWFSTDGGVTYQGPLVAVDSSGVRTAVNLLIRAVVTSGTTAPGCTWGIDPLSFSLAAGGGTGTVSVVAPAGCTWNASSDVPWVTFPSGTTGSGNGAVSFSVAPNTSGGGLAGNVTVAGLNVTVTVSGKAGRRRSVR